MIVHLSEQLAPTLASDILLGVIGLMSLGALITAVGALFSLGRAPYRKN
ncbi:hypothetical protein [Microbacterium sp. SORGH_AS_0888]|nr:hypothetical protein [Microbacterium sp. SORGH_AS_0888]MDQ1128069.1 hypothetical protein [Microbacterium sp. SORGH_AS_0888]